MTDLRKAAEMALNYIKDIRDHCACEGIDCEKENDLVAKLEAALAQPEPTACGYDETVGMCTNNPCCEQTPVSQLWECIGRWSSYLALNGEKANLAPPEWLVAAVKAATAPPRKEWVSLADDVVAMIEKTVVTRKQAIRMIEHHLKELNT